MWHTTLEGNRGSGIQWLAVSRPSVHNVAPILFIHSESPAWAVGGHLLLGIEHPHCWLRNNRPILPKDIFLVQRKILSLLGIKIRSYVNSCHFWKKLWSSFSEFCLSHLIVLNTHIQWSLYFQFQSLRWGLRNVQHGWHLSKKMFGTADCLQGMHWKANKSYYTKSTLENARLLVNYGSGSWTIINTNCIF